MPNYQKWKQLKGNWKNNHQQKIVDVIVNNPKVIRGISEKKFIEELKNVKIINIIR